MDLGNQTCSSAEEYFIQGRPEPEMDSMEFSGKWRANCP